MPPTGTSVILRRLRGLDKHLGWNVTGCNQRRTSHQKPDGVRMFMSLGFSLCGRAPWRRPSTVGISILGGATAWVAGLSARRVVWVFMTSMGEGFWVPRYACSAKPAAKQNKTKLYYMGVHCVKNMQTFLSISNLKTLQKSWIVMFFCMRKKNHFFLFCCLIGSLCLEGELQTFQQKRIH